MKKLTYYGGSLGAGVVLGHFAPAGFIVAAVAALVIVVVWADR